MALDISNRMQREQIPAASTIHPEKNEFPCNIFDRTNQLCDSWLTCHELVHMVFRFSNHSWKSFHAFILTYGDN